MSQNSTNHKPGRPVKNREIYRLRSTGEVFTVVFRSKGVCLLRLADTTFSELAFLPDPATNPEQWERIQ